MLYPISKQTYTMSIAPNEGQMSGDDSISARTSDGQEVMVDASVIYQIDPTKVTQMHIQWQDRYSDDLVRPVSRGVIRDVDLAVQCPGSLQHQAGRGFRNHHDLAQRTNGR